MLRAGLTVHEADRRPVRERAAPPQQPTLVRVRGQAACGVSLGCYLDRLSPKTRVLRAVDEPAAERALCLEADHDDVTLRPPQVALQVLQDSATAAHAAAGDYDRPAFDGIDALRILRRLRGRHGELGLIAE